MTEKKIERLKTKRRWHKWVSQMREDNTVEFIVSCIPAFYLADTKKCIRKSLRNLRLRELGKRYIKRHKLKSCR
jgi:hypothetical protein